MADRNTGVPSQQPLLPATTPAELYSRAERATLPSGWSPSQKSEYTARQNEMLGDLATNRYVNGIQTNTPFDLGNTLKDIPFSDTPSNIKARAATAENRVFGEDNPYKDEPRLTNAGMEHVKTLENGANYLSAKQKSGNPITTNDIKALGCNAEAQGLTGKDVANVAMLKGVSISNDVLMTLGSIKGSMCEASRADNKSPSSSQSSPAASTEITGRS